MQTDSLPSESPGKPFAVPYWWEKKKGERERERERASFLMSLLVRAMIPSS